MSAAATQARNAPEDWTKKSPLMAKRLEESLYRNAASFNEYNDASKVKHRLQQLAMNIGYTSQQAKLVQQQQAQRKLQEHQRQQLEQQHQKQQGQQHQHFSNSIMF